jgi:hypothetical protein
MYFRGEMLCPQHALQAVDEAGMTLDEAIGFQAVDPPDPVCSVTNCTEDVTEDDLCTFHFDERLAEDFADVYREDPV